MGLICNLIRISNLILLIFKCNFNFPQILRKLWLPDVEILNLKEFETHSVLSKLEGIWIDKDHQAS